VNRCQNVPPETNFEAVTAGVVTSLSTFAVKGQSPVRTGDMMIPLRETIVVLAQEKLISLGYLKDMADGDFGEKGQKSGAGISGIEKHGSNWQARHRHGSHASGELSILLEIQILDAFDLVP